MASVPLVPICNEDRGDGSVQFPVFNADVLGVILQFALQRRSQGLFGLKDCHSLACVCREWHTAFECCEPLWAMVMRVRYPSSRPSSWRMAVYSARVRGEKRLSGLERSDLHPIEDCPALWRNCPAFGEELRSTGSFNELLCTICEEKVYIVGSQKEFAQRKALGQCVQVDLSKVLAPTRHAVRLHPLAVVVLDQHGGSIARRLIQEVAHNAGSRMSHLYSYSLRSITLDPLRVSLSHGFTGEEVTLYWGCISKGSDDQHPGRLASSSDQIHRSEKERAADGVEWRYTGHCFMPSVACICDPELNGFPLKVLRQLVNVGVVIERPSKVGNFDLLRAIFNRILYRGEVRIG
jgi:hypothetical protein